jgi:hypothetical protein
VLFRSGNRPSKLMTEVKRLRVKDAPTPAAR